MIGNYRQKSSNHRKILMHYLNYDYELYYFGTKNT